MARIIIEKRQSVKKGETFRVRVLQSYKGKVVDKKSATFNDKKLAEIWGKKTQKELEAKQDKIKLGIYREDEKLDDVTVGELIRMYIEHPKIAPTLQRSKLYVLNALLSYEISTIVVSNLRADDLIKHCRTREAEPTRPKPQTIYQDVTYLKSVIDTARGMFKINASTQYHTEAIPVLINEKLIGRSAVRDRRPTKAELDLMLEGLKKREQHRSNIIPYSDILQISLLTAMRVGEITRIKWSDLDRENKTIIIRNRKDPRNKQGNDGEIPLLGGAFEIILKQPISTDPEKADLIFPFNHKSITAGWQRTRKELGIEDLRYHDLRREAASRLAEMGLPINIVAKITGHKNMSILHNIYTKIDVKEFGRKGYERYINK